MRRRIERLSAFVLAAEAAGCAALATQAWRAMPPGARPLIIVIYMAIPAAMAVGFVGAIILPAVARVNIAASFAGICLVCYLVELGHPPGTYSPSEGARAVAQRAGQPFDARSALTVMDDLEKAGITAFPWLNGPDLHGAQSHVAGAALDIGGRPVLPLTAGISGVSTIFCNEFGAWITYRSDERGFNNPSGLWDGRPIDVALVGDSHVHGYCVPPEATLAGRMRARYPRTVNLGIAGTGPLKQLGVMREYLPELRPRFVVWFFYEGNDLDDLLGEAADPFLMQYLDPRFRQNLSGLVREIDRGLIEYVSSARQKSASTSTSDRLRTALALRFVRSLLGVPGVATTGRPNASLYPAVIREARASVERAGASLIVVIIPARVRFQRARGTAWSDPDLFDRALVLGALRAEHVPVIDLVPLFAGSPHPLDLWWFEESHLAAEGYALAAGAVMERLSATR